MNPAEQIETTVLAGHSKASAVDRMPAMVMSFIAGNSVIIAASGFITASDYRLDSSGGPSTVMDALAANIHMHSVDWLVAVLLLFLGAALFDLRARVHQHTVRTILILYTIVLTASWCGSVLSWDDRAKQAFGIGTHIFDSYIPLAGTSISNYLWQSNRFREPSLMRVFLLHTLVLAPAVLLLVRALRKNAARSTSSVVAFGAGMVVPFCSAFLFSMASSNGVPVAIHTQQTLTQLRPAWYLGVPYEMFKSLPEDFVVALFGLAAAVLFAYGAGTGRSRSQRFGKWGARIVYGVYVAFQIQIFIDWQIR